MPQSVAWAAIKYIIVGVLLDILYFPVWWYTKGLVKTARFCMGSISRTASNLALGIWLKNMFTPMFGQYDWQGRMISFMVRIFMLIYKMIAFVIWTIVMCVLFIAWLALPLVVGWYALFQLVNLPFPFAVDVNL